MDAQALKGAQSTILKPLMMQMKCAYLLLIAVQTKEKSGVHLTTGLLIASATQVVQQLLVLKGKLALQIAHGPNDAQGIEINVGLS